MAIVIVVPECQTRSVVSLRSRKDQRAVAGHHRFMFIAIGTSSDHGFDQPLGLLSDCHRRIERFLGILETASQGAGSRASTAEERRGVEAALRYFATAAHMHTADEEESLFPRLRGCADAAAVDALAVVARLEGDHRDAERRHAEVDRLMRRWLDAGQLDPADATALWAHVAALRALYAAHITVEDTELFPAAARLLSAEAVAKIGGEMAARRGRIWQRG
jgi:hemerythrin-like domain-containing protein